jgi:peptidoglycan/LPS O-acetylase OafA/YrhL
VGFEKLFEGRPWTEIKERIGVMSVDTLNRIWLSFLAALAFAAYTKNKGRTYMWGVLLFLIVLVMQIYSEVSGGGPAEPMRTIYAFAIAGFLYFIAGQAVIAAEAKEKKDDQVN